MWPQYTILALLCISGGLFLAKHGQARTYNFWAWLVDQSILVWLLYEGGFFRGMA